MDVTFRNHIKRSCTGIPVTFNRALMCKRSFAGTVDDLSLGSPAVALWRIFMSATFCIWANFLGSVGGLTERRTATGVCEGGLEKWRVRICWASFCSSDSCFCRPVHECKSGWRWLASWVPYIKRFRKTYSIQNERRHFGHPVDEVWASTSWLIAPPRLGLLQSPRTHLWRFATGVHSLEGPSNDTQMCSSGEMWNLQNTLLQWHLIGRKSTSWQDVRSQCNPTASWSILWLVWMTWNQVLCWLCAEYFNLKWQKYYVIKLIHTNAKAQAQE